MINIHQSIFMTH